LLEKKIFGLTTKEAEASGKRFGYNELSKPAQETLWDKFKGNLNDPMIRILIVALLINVVFAATGNADWLETIGIFLAIMVATLVSTYSEYSNESAFQKLQEEASRIVCKVIRDGKPQEIGIQEIVRGDAVILQAGDRIPADGFLLDGYLKVDQSVLNGESEEASKRPPEKGQILDMAKVDFLNPHFVYRGSVVLEGEGIMHVEAVGDHSVYGKLTQELKSNERPSPLKHKLSILAAVISRVGYTGGVLIAVALMLHRILMAPSFEVYMSNAHMVLHDLMESIILGVIIIVMAVPEGLPLMVALVSSLNMKKMLHDNVLVRKLVGIETAGSLNILFTDKTGTITKGKLEVTTFVTGDGKVYSSFTDLPEPIRNVTYANCLMNTSATVSDGRIIGGNMTETALSRYLGTFTMDLPLSREYFVPFNSTNKYSWAHVVGDNVDLCLIKGAPEKLLPATETYYDNEGKKQPFTTDMKRSLDATMLGFAEKSIRMLGLFSRDGMIAGDKVPGNGLTLIGILGIRDDVRPESVKAIAEVHRAGIQVVMITGDRRETAMAIAKDAGILREPDDIVWTSDELSQMSDSDIKKQIGHLRVVARALPTDKSRLVRIAQEMGLVVGMTGDGVNDSPALKKADVGFAMGSGTEVAKEAGDIVILDDNFLSIKQAILYGRTIYNSICKFIVFQLSINFSAVAVNLIAPFIGIEHPLTVIQILWINLIMDTLAALAFGGEPALSEYLNEAPKSRSAPIVSRPMFIKIVIGGGYMTFLSLLFFLWEPMWHLFRPGPHHIFLYTGYFCTYVFMAVFNAFNVRVDSINIFEHLGANKGFLRINVMIIVIQVLMTMVGGRILRVRPLLPREWMAVLLISLSIIVVGTIFKAIMHGEKK
jgi:Ca2+-transporting ATPase